MKVNAGSCVWLCLVHYMWILFRVQFSIYYYYCGYIYEWKRMRNRQAYETNTCTVYSFPLSLSLRMVYALIHSHSETIRYRLLFIVDNFPIVRWLWRHWHSETILCELDWMFIYVCMCESVVSVLVHIAWFVLFLSVQLESEQCTWAKQRWMEQWN